MKKIKSIVTLFIVLIFSVSFINVPKVFADENKVNLFSGNVESAAWNMAVSLRAEKDGGDLDTSVFRNKGYFYVEYTGEKEGMQLILQSWSGGEGWALVDPSEVGVTEDNVNYAKFDEEAIKKAYKSNLTTLDAIHLWNVKGSFTLKSMDYIETEDVPEEPGNEDVDPSLKAVMPTEDNVRYLGRAYNYNDQLWLAASLSGTEFTFTGTKAEVTFVGDSFANDVNDNNARVAVYVDGELVVDKMITEKKSIVKVFESEEAKTVKVKILKLSESAMSTVGIKDIRIDKEGKVEKTENKARTIEVIGDSITCGYGVEDENRDHHFKTSTENAAKAYAYKTAEALDADLNVTAYSGYGIVSGYSGTLGVKNEKELLPKYYDKVGFSYGAFNSKLKPDSLEWDFDRFQPDIIVINLGTNDTNYCNSEENKAEFTEGYEAFVKTVREKNPNSKILCTLGTMGDSLYEYIEKAVDNYKTESEDTNIYTMRFNVQNGEADGYAADWHPTEKTHEKSAAKLTEEIKNIMNWE